jgi:hypothetical protein
MQQSLAVFSAPRKEVEGSTLTWHCATCFDGTNNLDWNGRKTDWTGIKENSDSALKPSFDGVSFLTRSSLRKSS